MRQDESTPAKLCMPCAKILYPDVEYEDMGFVLVEGVECARCGQLTGVFTYDDYGELKK